MPKLNSPIDLGFQVAYKVAYRMMRAYWRVRRPHTHGALVALWHNDTILLVKNSYLSYYSLPGGYVRPSETGRQAALRELKEEVGLDSVAESALSLAVDVQHDWEGKRDHVEIFEVNLETPVTVQIDNREVVEALWLGPKQALQRELFPPIARHIREREAKRS